MFRDRLLVEMTNDGLRMRDRKVEQRVRRVLIYDATTTISIGYKSMEGKKVIDDREGCDTYDTIGSWPHDLRGSLLLRPL